MAGVEGPGHRDVGEVIAVRQGDGYEADIGFAMPAPAPGVWQLPPGQSPLIPWASKMRPFLMVASDQFRPGPPPALRFAVAIRPAAS